MNVVLAIMLICSFLRGKLKFSFRLFLPPVFTAVSLVFALFLIGLYFAGRSPVKYRNGEFLSGDSRHQWVSASPRNGRTGAKILYFFDSDKTDIETEARSVIRPLVNEGFAVDATGVDSGFGGLSLAREFVGRRCAGSSGESMVFGRGSGGRIAILAGASEPERRITAGIALDSEMSWPFPELSATDNAEKIKFPLLLIYNLSFILPLVVFFALAATGVSIWKMLAFSRREAAPAKIAIGILFLVLATIQLALTMRS